MTTRAQSYGSLDSQNSNSDGSTSFIEPRTADNSESESESIPLVKNGARHHYTRSVWYWIKSNIFIISLILSMFVGVGLGLALRPVIKPDDSRNIMYVRFVGEIFLRVLTMLVLPLIFSSLVTAVASLDSHASGRLGLWSVILYIVTTFLAILLGILLVYFIKPGHMSPQECAEHSRDFAPADNEENERINGITSKLLPDSLLDLVRNMLPDNILAAAFRSTKTYLFQPLMNISNVRNFTDEELIPQLKHDNNSNILGVVVFALWMGVILVKLQTKGKPLVDVIRALENVTMEMVTLVIMLSPIGIAFLVAAEIIRINDFEESFKNIGKYMGTVLLGLAIHGLLILPFIYFITTRSNPYVFIKGIFKALVTAFGTASGSATLPVSYVCLEENLGLDRRVTRFVMPVGTTINMNGTALYEAVATVFIAELSCIEMTFQKYVVIALTSTLAAVGAASIPQAGLVTMLIVLNAAGVPSTEIAQVLAIDWLLDRFRTMTNVLGDCFVTGIVNTVTKQNL